MDTLTQFTTALKDGGPWALMSIAFLALGWLARLYVKARDNSEKELKEQSKGLAELITDMVRVGEKQIAAADLQTKASEQVTHELRTLTGAINKVQEQQRRVLREAGLGENE